MRRRRTTKEEKEDKKTIGNQPINQALGNDRIGDLFFLLFLFFLRGSSHHRFA
jgi:hypothetical protein